MVLGKVPGNSQVMRHTLRNRAIDEYHDLLAADEALSSVVFEKFRSAMRITSGDGETGFFVVTDET